MTPRALTVSLRSRRRLGALCWRSPDPTGPPLILVHGLGDSAWVWQGVAPALARHRHVFAVDLRGHGSSAWAAPGGYSVAEMAADVLAFADLLVGDLPLLVGHSLGAAVAIHAGAAAPTKISRLALVDYLPEVPEQVLKIVRSALASMHDTYASIADYVAILRRRHILADPALLQHVAHGALRASAGGYVPTFDPAALDALCDTSRLSTVERVAGLALPTHVVRGALSWMVSKEGAQRLVDALPSATFAVVPMAGHCVHIDNPRGLLAALAPMLEH